MSILWPVQPLQGWVHGIWKNKDAVELQVQIVLQIEIKINNLALLRGRRLPLFISQRLFPQSYADDPLLSDCID